MEVGVLLTGAHSHAMWQSTRKQYLVTVFKTSQAFFHRLAILCPFTRLHLESAPSFIKYMFCNLKLRHLKLKNGTQQQTKRFQHLNTQSSITMLVYQRLHLRSKKLPYFEVMSFLCHNLHLCFCLTCMHRLQGTKRSRFSKTEIVF